MDSGKGISRLARAKEEIHPILHNAHIKHARLASELQMNAQRAIRTHMRYPNASLQAIPHPAMKELSISADCARAGILLMHRCSQSSRLSPNHIIA